MIMIGCPIKDRAWAVPHWMKGIASQCRDDVRVVALYTPSEDDTEAVLKEYGVEIIYDDEVGRPVHEIDRHQWGAIDRFEYMSRLRNKLVNYAVGIDADYFLSLDSDIVLPEDGLQRLLGCIQMCPGVVAPAVNMAHNGLAWNVMHWSNHSAPGLPNRDRPAIDGKVDVVMAAMLLDRSAMDCRWFAHMAGEDIGFCLDCEDKDVARYWLSTVRCQHLMRRV